MGPQATCLTLASGHILSAKHQGKATQNERLRATSVPADSPQAPAMPAVMPVVSVLEGGYNLGVLKGCAAEHVEVLLKEAEAMVEAQSKAEAQAEARQQKEREDKDRAAGAALYQEMESTAITKALASSAPAVLPSLVGNRGMSPGIIAGLSTY